MEQLPSAFKSSETYMALGGIISGAAIAIGVDISADEADLLLKAIGAIIGGIVSIGSVVMAIKSRTELKKEVIRSSPIDLPQVEVEAPPTDKPFEVIPR